MTDEQYQEYLNWEGKCFEEYGYLMHDVSDVYKPGFTNIHTHGLEAYDSGRNIRTVMDVSYAPYLVRKIADQIMEGWKVSPDISVISDGTVYGYLIEDPDHLEDLQEEGMLRLVFTRDFETDEDIDPLLIIQQSYPLCKLKKKEEGECVNDRI